MNKIKKYSLEQLAKVQPLLNETEMLCILGGYEKEDPTYYYFLAHEIRQMFPNGNIPLSFESYWEREFFDDGTESFTSTHYYRITKVNYQKLYGSDTSDYISNNNTNGDSSSSSNPNVSNESSDSSGESSESSSESSESSENSSNDAQAFSEFINHIFMTTLSAANKSNVSSQLEQKIKTAFKTILEDMDNVSEFNIIYRSTQTSLNVSFTEKVSNNKIGEFTIDFLEETVE